MTDAKDSWRRVRGTRASPPALAGQDDDRRRVYQAALQQAEELWDAAAAVGPASRPLALFYCLSQAGRAVCAAWTAEAEWRPKRHGLRRRNSEAATPEERVFEHATAVDDRPFGSFGMVARATESELFADRVAVADLWVSLSEFRTPPALVGDRPRCLYAKAVTTLPEDDRPAFQKIGSPLYATFLPGTRELTADGYPTLRGMELHGVRQGVIFEERVYRFPREDGSLRPLWQIGDRRDWEPGDPVRNMFVVRPGIGENAASLPSEFLTMWALLFCLSELARYYPDTWVGALNPDTSSAAVTLEHGLDVALTRAPELIAGALRGPIARLTQEMVERMERDLREREELGAAREPIAEGAGPVSEDAPR